MSKPESPKPSKPGKVRLPVYLDPDVHLALLRRSLDESAAAGHRISATALVERLIAQYLKKGGRA